MIRIFIADDEVVVREGIKNIIDWNEIGYEICGEAGDGKTALEEIHRLKPDVLLLDIRMPKMQGLEVAKIMRDEGYSGDIVILSGYSEFSYAKEAIKCDVHSYLTKPIEEEELKRTMIEIKNEQQKRKMHSDHLNYYQEKAKFKILQDIMVAGDSQNLATMEYSLTELNLSADIYQILIVEPMSTPYEDGKTLFKALCQHLKVPDTTQSIENLKIETMAVLLLKGDMVIQKFDSLKAHMNDLIDVMFISAGRVVGGINDVYYSYHDALAILERKFFFTKENTIVGFEDLPAGDTFQINLTAVDSKAYGKEVYDHIQIYSKDGVRESLDKLEETLHIAKNSVESIKSFLAGMFLYIKQEYKRDYVNVSFPFEANAEIIGFIHRCHYLDEVMDYIEEQVYKMIAAISLFDSDSIVDEVVSYISHNYHKNIKLKTLAPKFGYNSSYLGKVFSKKMGISFNDYLHQIRIDKAKDLIQDDKYKVYEISEMVGYKNVDYFHQKFRQNTGCTPIEFRQNDVSSSLE